MRSLRLAALPCLALAVAATLAACSSDDGDDASPSPSSSSAPESSPASSAPPTTPVADPVAAVEGCLAGADLTSEPEDDPRFGALAEIQVDVSGNSDFVGVFVYATPEDATQHEQELVDAGSSGTEIVGTVVLSGADTQPGSGAEGVAGVRACAAATVE
ncbi:MAG TPA: hypothetical protein VNS55_14775 [Nocardioides sp.]|nr:hypothetical protein [Nocardioides sp.]